MDDKRLLKLLVIEDVVADFLMLGRHLSKHGLEASCERVDSFEALTAALTEADWDAVLTDFNLPGMNFAENLALLRSVLRGTPIILVTGTIGEEAAIDALKSGVADFVLKDNLARLVPTIERSLREASEHRARQAIEQKLRERDELLRETSALARIGGWTFDPSTASGDWTEEVARIYELEPRSVAGSVLDLVGGDAREQLDAAMARAVAHGEPFDIELEVVTAKASRKWVRAVGVPIHEGGRVVKLRGSMQDISDRKRAERMLFEQKERAQITLQSIADAVITTDAEGLIDYMNPVAEQLSGWNLEAAMGQPLPTVLSLVDAQTGQPMPIPMAQALAEGGPHRLSGSSLLVRPDGSRSAIEDSVAPIRGRDGEIVGGVLVFHDVTEAREITARIAYQATHDALTGLPNRLLAWDRLNQAIAAAERGGHCVGVMFLDLDRFKNINDSLGHNLADGLLKQVAERLTSVTRGIDTVSRQGGDEFTVIIPNAQRARFADLAEKILNVAAATYLVEQHELSVTFSIGISVYPDDGADAEMLVKNADAAMYAAKANGRNNFQFYAREMNRRAAARLQLEGELRHALARGEFEVYYQPKVDAADGHLSGAEALIRWNHPDKGIVSPAEFISIAEESGLIVPIGRWITQEVCRQNRAWLLSGLPCVPISVNLSALQFRDRSLVASLRTILLETGLPPRLLELELTESFLMQASEAVVGALHKLKELGIGLSIDDFGTGYSSLSYLKRFPIDTLKIDQVFVRDIPGDNDDAAIIDAIISMGHSLRLSVIAEGVETTEQLEFLKALGCDEIQGYYFGRPMPTQEFAKMLCTVAESSGTANRQESSDPGLADGELDKL